MASRARQTIKIRTKKGKGTKTLRPCNMCHGTGYVRKK